MSLSNLEKKLLENANPDLLEYLQSKFQNAVTPCEANLDLLNQEHYDAAKQLAPRVTNSLVSFMKVLSDMQTFAETGELPESSNTTTVEPTTVEPTTVEPAVENIVTDQTIPPTIEAEKVEGGGQLV